MTELAFEARGLARWFGTTAALERLDLTVGKGEVVCLLGANGAGKTTTVNLFLGFLEPSAGEALVFGRPAFAERQAALARVAYVPETVTLYPQLTGIENLAFLHALSGGRSSRAELERCLREADLDPAAFDRRTSGYSKGMRQKVVLAAAYARGADAWLLDEPFSGLDPHAASEFALAIRARAGTGTAILMVTHDLFRARDLATRIGIMREGRLLDLIDASSVDHAALEALYLRHVEGAA